MGDKDYYFIEGATDKDLIGFDSYIYALKNAIQNNSRFIGLVSDFGTGKSSLIEMLKQQKLEDWDLQTINLWNCNDSNIFYYNEEINIHRVFLHQLIEKLFSPKVSDYYKKKINKKYRMFDLKLNGSCIVYGIFLFIFYIMCVFDRFSFISLFPCELNKFLVYILISILTVLCILIYKPLLSFDKSNTINDIDENDTKDLYKEIIEKYNKKNKNQKLIICIEELDRYIQPLKVKKCLEEFYKFYKLSDDNVVFIIALKSAALLHSNEITKAISDKTSKTSLDEKIIVNETKCIYEKVFDFILNMNRVNIDDFDSILLDLLTEKQDDLPQYVKKPEIDNMGFWRYLYYGKNTTIRDIKHRYNFAVSLYESILCSGIKDAKFEICVYISYLEDEYNTLYNKLISDNELLSNILSEYAKTKNINSINNLSTDERDVLLNALMNKYISVDCRYYFYKFPKNKKPYNIFELNLYNAIYFDEDSENIELALRKINSHRIEEILKKRIDKMLLPKVVLEHSKLIEVAYIYDKKAFINTLQKRYDIVNDIDTFSLLVNKIKSVDHDLFISIMTVYFEQIFNTTIDLSMEEKNILRLKLVKLFKEDSIALKIFFEHSNTMITFEEMQNINNLETIFGLTNFKLIDDAYINNITKFTNKTTKKYLLGFIKSLSTDDHITSDWYKTIMSSIKFVEYDFSESNINAIFRASKTKFELNSLSNFEVFLQCIKGYSALIDNWYTRILDINNYQSIDNYVETCKKYDFASDAGVDIVDKCNKKFILNDKMLQKLYERGHYYTYVASSTLSKRKFEIDEDKFENLKQSYISFFINTKEWNYIVDEPMIKFLHKNVNVSDLGSKQLIVFVEEIQTTNLIDAILSTDDYDFINDYFSKIHRIKAIESDVIYEKIGTYHKQYHLKQKARRNLIALAKNDRQKRALYVRNSKRTLVSI